MRREATTETWRRRFAFWSCFARETAATRRLAPLVRARLGQRAVVVAEGLANIPNRGLFVLAANHYGGRPALDETAAILRAVGQARPDLAERWALVVGRRAPRGRRGTPLRKATQLALECVYQRWGRHVLRIPLDSAAPSVTALRAWRARLATQPTLVYPEGRARRVFGAVRPGAGRWLAALPTPVVPVGVWTEGRCWRIAFGPPLPWAARRELRDAQLGLWIATLLPPSLAPAWQGALATWRAIGESPNH